MARAAWLVAAILLVAACGSTTQPTSPTAAPPSATASAMPASPRPSVAPLADPATAALKAFVAFATKPGQSYQATFTGHQRASATILTISKGLLEVDGAAVLVRATFTFPNGGGTTAVEHRFVDGKAWLRFGSGAWQRLSGFGPAQSMAAFAAVRTVADVTPLGPISVKGKTLYKVRIRSVIVNPVMVPAANLSDEAVTSSRLDLLLDAAGRPVSGEAEITGQGRVSGQLQEIAIDLAVTFSKVGQPVSISAP